MHLKLVRIIKRKSLLQISRAHDERAREALDAEIQQSGPNLLNLYEAKWRFFYGDNVATALREHAKFFYISHSVAGELQECALDDQRFSRLLELTALKIHDCRYEKYALRSRRASYVNHTRATWR